MAELTFEELIKVRNNPSKGINLILDRVQETLNNGNATFESLSHPFIAALDAIAASSWANICRIEDAEARLFPSNARKAEDVYRHMSDESFWGLFGSPSETSIRYAIPVEEIERLSIYFNETSGTVINRYRKLCIPKDTIIDVNGLKFLIINQIEFRLMDSGYIQVVYNSEKQNPFYPLINNVINKDHIYSNGKEYIYIDVPVKQLEYDYKRSLSISPSAGLKGRIKFQDKLFGVAAWILQNGSNSYKPVSIVYNNDVIDPEILTLTLTLNQDEGYFDYRVPDTYINSGLATGSISILVYTTKGPLQLDLSELSSKSHTATYVDLSFDSNQLDKYCAGIKNVNNSEWKITKSVMGGTNPRTFSELKQAYRYVNRLTSLPVSDNQLTFDFKRYGYELVKSTDYPSGRLFRLTREIPDGLNPDNKNMTIGCFVGSLTYSLDELKKTGMVYDNGSRVTIPPNTLIRVTDYHNTLLPIDEVTRLNGMTISEKVEYTNNNFTIFNPYYYLIDATNNQVSLRSYLLDSPSFKYQNFLYERSSLGIELSVGSISVNTTENGYTILLVTKSDDTYKAMSDDAIGVQLSIKPIGATVYASVKGTLLSRTTENERVWEFKLKSKFDIDQKDNLILNDISMYSDIQPNISVNLNDDIKVLFLVNGEDTKTSSKSDALIDNYLFPKKMLVAVEMGYSIIFGKSMEHLFSRIRPVKGGSEYQRYEADVYDTYVENEFKVDEDNHLVMGDDNRPILVHRAGEVRYDSEGLPIVKYAKGQFKYNDDGTLVPIAPAELKFHMDFFGFDGMYYFSNDEYDQAFLKATKDYITDTVMGDMDYLSHKVLELSKVVYQPKRRLGYINVVLNTQIEAKIKPDFTFQVIFYLTKGGYDSDTLKDALETSTKNVINDVLKNVTFSKKNLMKALMEIVTDEVIDFKVIVMSGTKEIEVATQLDSTSGFAVRKLLEATGDEILSVKEAIVINFLKHYKEVSS